MSDVQTGRGGAARTVVFVALVVIAAAIHVRRMSPPRPATAGRANAPTNGIGLQQLQQLEMLAKYAYGVEHLLRISPQGAQQSQQVRGQVQRGLGKLTTKQTYRLQTTRQLAILCAMFGEAEQARRRFDRAAELSKDPRERALWRRIFGDEKLTSAQLANDRQSLTRMQLGWYEHLVVEAAARKAGDSALATQAHQRAVADSSGLAITLVLAAIGFVVIVALGVGLLLLVAILATSGRMKFGTLDGLKLPARPLFETFALFFFLMEVAPLRPAITVAALPLLPTFLSLAFAACSLGWLSLHLRAAGLTLHEIGWRCRRWWEEAVWGLAGWLAAIPLVLGSAVFTFLLAQRMLPDLPPPSHPIQQFVSGAPNLATLLMTFALAVIVAPLLEETFFRGILHGALRRRFGPWVATIGSAFVFAAVHPQLPLGFPPLFLLGATFSVLFELRGSLIPCIVAHATNNGLLMLLMFGIMR